MYVEVAENRLAEARTELRQARKYRRAWAGITAGCAVVTGVATDLAPKVAHHTNEIRGPVGVVVVAVGALATVGSFTQILDGFTQVGSVKRDVREAERDVQEAVSQAALQPELEFGT